jgi:histidinol-phosphate phosphatase family protein
VGWNIDNSWTLFLDRDGVLNRRIPDDYVRTIEELEIMEGVTDAIAEAAGRFGRIVVVTNQQGIGKGLMTERNLSDIHRYLLESVMEQGGRIDAFYHAPHLAAENNPMRKPGPGMGHAAQKEFPEIDFSKSVMVGDSDSDIRFGLDLGMKTVFITTKRDRTELPADLYAGSLQEAITKILS